MTHVPHELAEEFPAEIALIRQMRQSDTRMARLCEDYHRINRTLHRVDCNLEPMCDVEALRLRKTRIALKDQIAHRLRLAELA